jgi:ABC-type phosphate transport system substrate-binding protein
MAALALAACGGGGGGENAGAPALIRIDGSSTVFPISEAVAEEFQRANPGLRVTVAVSGTGGGFERFCRGETDISNASRPIFIFNYVSRPAAARPEVQAFVDFHMREGGPLVDEVGYIPLSSELYELALDLLIREQ